MKILDPQQTHREAKIRYLDADFQVVREGDFVRCAATGKPIPLTALRYWDVGRQQPVERPLQRNDLNEQKRC